VKSPFTTFLSFRDIEELNRTVRKYKEEFQSSVQRSDVKARLTALLELLKRYSCKQIGVSYMCKRTIAQKMELAYKTVQRLVKKLEDLGMIRQVAMKRKKDMLQTANAIVIIPAKQEMSGKTPPNKSGKCPTNKTTSLSLKQKIINTKRKAAPISIMWINLLIKPILLLIGFLNHLHSWQASSTHRQLLFRNSGR
jgi:predicted transcriptional regulator